MNIKQFFSKFTTKSAATEYNHRVNNINRQVSFINNNEIHLQKINELNTDPYKILNGCSIISLCIKLLMNNILSFEIAVINESNQDEVVDQKNSFLKLLNNPHRFSAPTLEAFINKFTLEFICGKVYVLFDKEQQTMKVLYAKFITEMFTTYQNLDQIPTSLRCNIEIIENNKLKTLMQTFNLDFESGYYVDTEGRYIICRFEDFSKPDMVNSVGSRNSSSLTPLAYLISAYMDTEQIIASLFANPTIANVLPTPVGIEEQLTEIAQRFANESVGFMGKRNIGKVSLFKYTADQDGSKAEPKLFELNTLPKTSTLIEYQTMLRKQILQCFPVSIPEQLIDASSAHYNSRDDAGISFAQSTYAFYSSNLFSPLSKFMNYCLFGENNNLKYSIKIKKESHQAFQEQELNKMNANKESYSINERRNKLGLPEKEGNEYNEVESITRERLMTSNINFTNEDNMSKSKKIFTAESESELNNFLSSLIKEDVK
jgi:hypothetical protein